VNRRDFIMLLGGAAAWPLAARAQQSERMRRIGVLLYLVAGDAEGQARLAGANRGALMSFETSTGVRLRPLGSKSLAECPLLGRTGHAGMARMRNGRHAINARGRARYLVIILLGAVMLGVCSAGEITNVTQAFQPAGRFWLANSQ
jgi:hypothetical protein